MENTNNWFVCMLLFGVYFVGWWGLHNWTFFSAVCVIALILLLNEVLLLQKTGYWVRFCIVVPLILICLFIFKTIFPNFLLKESPDHKIVKNYIYDHIYFDWNFYLRKWDHGTAVIKGVGIEDFLKSNRTF